MKFYVVWTLRRGILDPPEYLDAETQYELERAYVQEERDAPLTEKEWRDEVGYRRSSARRRRYDGE
jgi:hypothetical protein